MIGAVRGSTRARLTLVYTAAFAIVVIVAAVAYWLASSQFEYNSVDASLRADGNAVRATVAGGDFNSTPVLPTRSATGLPIDAFLIGSDGSLLAASATAVSFQSVVGLLPRGSFPDHAVISTVSLSEGPARILMRQLSLPSGVIAGMLLVRLIDDVRFRLAQSAALLVLIDLALIVACSLLAWRLAGQALAPVRKMSEIAREITEGDHRRRLPETLPSTDEIGQLAMTFNAMLDRLDESFETLQRFTADAAHELRAPISIMRAQLDVTMSKPRSPDDYVKANATLFAEVARLGRIADQLLLLARADARALRLRRQTLVVRAIVDGALERWTTQAHSSGVRLTAGPIDHGNIDADPDLLDRLFDNLIDNGIRHAGNGGAVDISATDRNSRWTVTVSDTGPGVPVQIRGAIFSRFVKGDGARGRSSGGAGLGLSICDAIVRLHGGTIELAPQAEGRGATFAVHLPADHQAPHNALPAPAIVETR